MDDSSVIEPDDGERWSGKPGLGLQQRERNTNPPLHIEH
jgi:hypothetical protein